jgi:hypothetical protein
MAQTDLAQAIFRLAASFPLCTPHFSLCLSWHPISEQARERLIYFTLPHYWMGMQPYKFTIFRHKPLFCQKTHLKRKIKETIDCGANHKKTQLKPTFSTKDAKNRPGLAYSKLPSW